VFIFSRLRLANNLIARALFVGYERIGKAPHERIRAISSRINGRMMSSQNNKKKEKKRKERKCPNDGRMDQ
jgi:hypothetical protein